MGPSRAILSRRRLAGGFSIWPRSARTPARRRRHEEPVSSDKIRSFRSAQSHHREKCGIARLSLGSPLAAMRRWCRSEEHTSELQSQSNLVCRLLLEKKKKQFCARGDTRENIKIRRGGF